MIGETGVLLTAHKKSMINGLRVRVLRESGDSDIEVIVLKSHRHYSRHDVLVVSRQWFFPD